MGGMHASIASPAPWRDESSSGMPDHALKLRDLIKIMASYGVAWDASRGKGSHGVFWKIIDGGKYTYPVPNRKEVLVCYVKGCRKKFRLTTDDGVTDEEFYGRA